MGKSAKMSKNAKVTKSLLDGFVAKKPVMKKPSQSVEVAKGEGQVSKYDQTIKGRWVERNLSTLSPSFQEAWRLCKEKKDKAAKTKLLSAVVKDDGGRNLALTGDHDVVNEMVSEIRSKSMGSTTKSYGKTLMVQKCGGLTQFQEALTNGEITEVPGPADCKTPYFAFKSFHIDENVKMEDKMSAHAKPLALSKSAMSELEAKLRSTEFFFESKGKKDTKWTIEAQESLQRATQQAQALVGNALGLLKRTSASTTVNQLEQTAQDDLKSEVKNMQSLVTKMQNVIVDGLTMEEGKVMVGDYVTKSEDLSTYKGYPWDQWWQRTPPIKTNTLQAINHHKIRSMIKSQSQTWDL